MTNGKKVNAFLLPLLALGSLASLSACGSSGDVLTVYNWEDYIYDGTDEKGDYIEDGVIELFEKYYEEKHGKKITVDYQCFSTNEDMYQQIDLGSISPDLICPSDYMIQKMANSDMLEKFSYDADEDKYGESLNNWETYGSPFIRKRFADAKLEDGSSFLEYAVPYFWGTMGFTYRSDYFEPEEVGTWECLWNTGAKYKKAFSLKDSMRDTYVAAIFHVYRDEIMALNEEDPQFNKKLDAIFNRCDDNTIAKVEAALKQAKASTVFGFEVDEGKDDIVTGKYQANLAWSGDSVYSMDNAEKAGITLNYSLPEEGSNVWFDGWVMPKGANKELAEEFVNFISRPDIAAKSMGAVGYTSPIVGSDIWDLVNEWYAGDEGEETVDYVDLSFYFGDSIGKAAVIAVPSEERGRQFDAQYPTLEVLNRCCIMKDFGEQQTKVEDMWARVTSD